MQLVNLCSVGVLEDKSSSSRTVLKSLVLALRLVSLTPSLNLCDKRRLITWNAVLRENRCCAAMKRYMFCICMKAGMCSVQFLGVSVIYYVVLLYVVCYIGMVDLFRGLSAECTS